MSRINLQNAARYIHGQAPGKLNGLYQAVKAKCDALGLEPGRRDTVAQGADDAAGAVSGNIRGILTFVESVQPLPADLEDDAEAQKADAPTASDTIDDLLAKRESTNLRRQRKDAHARLVAQVKADHATLKKLLGTLRAKFAAANYTPQETTALV